MKKKVLTLLLAMSVMATVFTGCNVMVSHDGSVEISEESPEASSEESIEASVEASSEESTEASVEASAEESTEASVEASSEESTEASTEASVEASTEASVEASTETSVEANVATGEWATAYDNYFEEHQIMRDNAQLSASVTEEGITMNIVVAVAGEDFYMSYDFDTIGIDIYAIGDKMYSNTYMMGEESWVVAPIESEEDTEGVLEMDTTTVENDSINSWTYKEEVTENGVIYDVLEVEFTDDEGTVNNMDCYVNRETQEIDKYVMEQDGTVIDFLITDIESIELPAESANATEGTAEDIAMGLVTVIFMAAMGSAAQ